MNLVDIDADLIEPQRLAGCVMDQIKVDRRKQNHAANRPLTPLEGLKALRYEAQVVAVTAQNIAAKIDLSPDDLARMLITWHLIDAIYNEVVR